MESSCGQLDRRAKIHYILIMRFILSLLGNLAGIYMLLIVIRVMLSWFSGISRGRPQEMLRRITDPYLDWWRRFRFLRAGAIDLSPVAALAALSLAQSVFGAIARYGRVRVGVILSIVLSALWSAVSFILGFFIIILILRFIAYITNQDIHGGFWRVIDSISQPVLHRITGFFFRDRIINYLTGIILSALVLIGLFVLGGFLAGFVSYAFMRLPL
jgi:YggT family protein